MLHKSLVLICGAVLMFVANEDAVIAQTAAPAFVPGDLVLGYQSQADRDQALQSFHQVRDNASIRGAPVANADFQAVGGSSIRVHLPSLTRERGIRGSAGDLQTLQDTAARIKQNDKRVIYAHPNWILNIDPVPPREPIDVRGLDSMVFSQSVSSGPNDYAYVRGLHWDYAPLPMGMNAVGAWKSETGSADVVVAVIDSGLLLDHPDVKGSGNVLPGYNFVSAGTGRSADGTDPGDACPPSLPHASWHGSHVAGTVGVVGTNNGRGITGINWNVSVLPIRVMGLCGRGTIVDISDGIRWAAGLPVDGVPAAQSNKHPAHVINLSLGGVGTCSYEQRGVLIDAINAARKAGSVVVVAAGNDSMDITDSYPAGCPGVISVAASDRLGHLAWYSNYGSVSIMAPGGDLRVKDESGYAEGVWSIVRTSDINPQGIEPMQGTSQAAPHVAGAIALALAKHPEWRGKPDLVAEKLKAAAVPAQAAACAKPCGPGQLDAERLVESH
jgi:subtilisin family serine protease